MVKLRDRFLRLWAREKHVSGFTLDIDVKPRDSNDTQPWYLIKGVAYIPANEHDLLRLDMAEEMGLNIETGGVVDICWKLAHDNKLYEFCNSFLVKTDLPNKVIFGKQRAPKSIEGYPCPFDRATRQTYDQSYDFPKSHNKSWGRKTLSLGPLGSVPRKGDGRRPSVRQSTLSPTKPPPRNLIRTGPNSPKLTDKIAQRSDARRNLEIISTNNGSEHSSNQLTKESTIKSYTENSKKKRKEKREKVGLEFRSASYSEGMDIFDTAKSHDRQWGSDLRTPHEKADTLAFSGSRTNPSKIKPSEGPFSVPVSSGSSRIYTQEYSRRSQNSLRRISFVVQIKKSNADHSVGSEHQHSDSVFKNKNLKEPGPENDIKPLFEDASGNPYSPEAAHAKIKARKRGKTPRIRSVKKKNTEPSPKVEVTSEPGADGWIYDPSVKAHYQVDSETGSFIWYSDSDPDSDFPDDSETL